MPALPSRSNRVRQRPPHSLSVKLSRELCPHLRSPGPTLLILRENADLPPPEFHVIQASSIMDSSSIVCHVHLL
ncbi:hypothetical protein FRX31_033623 [Thalictrum thalictroides]|uniref:Uncharacterized protein n=1 Tax=Thalictrum thalictroides TaxID=46969 RepID=A0A7J6UWC5_THATH|nr:hypothetical protein FRX31_033623 [Thalictrum thalictroides]